METSDSNQNNVPIITPQPSAPKRRRMARWLTLAIAAFVIGGGAIWWLARDNDKIVQAAPAASVEITADGFVPQTIRVKKGDTITWTNKDTQPHQTASDPYPANDGQVVLNSQEALAEGESYTATFENIGTFTYHDELNPTGFKATVIVE